jgi:hypothetical protein
MPAKETQQTSYRDCFGDIADEKWPQKRPRK